MAITKRLLAVLLAVMVCLCSFPAVFAQGETVPAVKQVEAEPMEKIFGDYYIATETHWDENNQEIAKDYICYDIYYPQFTVVLEDGTRLESEYGDVFYEGEYYSINIDDPQCYTNQWTKEGSYQVDASIMGFNFTFTVNIVPSPIKSLEIPDVVYIENTNGKKVETWLDNEQLSDEYYMYWMPDGEITLNDGSTEWGPGFDDNGEYYPIQYQNDQGYYNQWKAGQTYTVTANLLGCTDTFTVKIVESPVASVECPSVVLQENVDGWYDNDSIVQEDGSVWETDEYFVYSYDADEFEVTFKDGTKKTVDSYGLEYEGQEYYFEWNARPLQDYQNQWTVGNTYQAPCSFMGKDFTISATVVRPCTNDTFEYLVVDGGVIITGYLGEMEVDSLEIPAKIDGKPVVGVSELNDVTTESLTFPDSVVTLGDNIFYWVYGLRSVDFGAGVKNLTADMFQYNKLETITVSQNNPYFTVSDRSLFTKDGSKLIAVPREYGQVTIPKTCTDLSALDMEGYEDIAVLYEGEHPYFVTVDGVTYTKDMKTVVSCAKTKAGSYVMPDTVETIKTRAFYNCKELTQVTVSPKVTEIVYSAFAGCTALTDITLPQNLKTIEGFAFGGTKALTKVDLPNGLQTIQAGAFEDGGLTGLTLPDSVKTVEGSAFQNNPIVALNLGKGVKTIGGSAFRGCAMERLLIPDTVTQMDGYAFADCKYLRNVKIGKGLTQLDDGVFYNSALVGVVVPENIMNIGSSAFKDCGDLQFLDIQNPACTMEKFAFSGCRLQSLTLGNKLTQVPESAFAGSAFETLKVPQSVTSLVYRSFLDCQNLKEITLPDTLTHVGGEVFKDTAWFKGQKDGVVSLNTVTLGWKGDPLAAKEATVPNTTKVLADYAFQDCKNLTAVTLPEGLVTIGAYAFYDCGALETLSIPSTVTTIGKMAFEECVSLKNLAIPAGVAFIGEDAFLGCDSLQTITVDAGNKNYKMVDKQLCTMGGEVLFTTKEQSKEEEPKLEGIYISRDPYKRQYKKGDTLDLTGMVVEAYYTGDVTKDITHEVTAKLITDIPGEERVEVAYQGFTDALLIEYETDSQPYCVNYELEENPTKLEYELGEKLDLTGARLKVWYSDGSTETISQFTDATVTYFGDGDLGKQTAEVEIENEIYFYIEINRICKHKKTYVKKSVDAGCCTFGVTQGTYCVYCEALLGGAKGIAPNGNNHAAVEFLGKVDPTCQQEGYSGDKTCIDCGKVLEKGKDLDKIGHTVKDWTIVKEATTAQGGEKKGACVHCNKTLTVQTEKLVETFDNNKVEGMEQVTVTLEKDTTLPAEAVFVVDNVTDALGYGETQKVQVALAGTELTNPVAACVLDMGFVTRETAVDGSVLADQKVDFKGEVTVTLPAPKEVLEATVPVRLFHILDNGSVEEVEYTLKDGVITFTATGFSYYVFVQEWKEENIPYGDMNGDGEINAKDALQVLKLAVGKEELTEELLILGDVDMDEKVSAKDALEILKYTVGKPSVFDHIDNG